MPPEHKVGRSNRPGRAIAHSLEDQVEWLSVSGVNTYSAVRKHHFSRAWLFQPVVAQHMGNKEMSLVRDF